MSQIVIVAGGILVACVAAAALVWGESEGRESVVEAIGRGGASDAAGEPAPSGVASRTRRRVVTETARGGYTGTAHVRGGDAYEGPRSTPWGRSRRGGWRDDYFPAEGDLETLAARIPRQTRYEDLLRLLHRLGGPFEIVGARAGADGTPATRWRTEPGRMRGILEDALSRTSTGVLRQALIFHAALALPREHVLPLLRRLASSADPDDAADARCAMAFSGDEDAVTWFRSLPPDPAAVVREPLIYSADGAAKLYADGRRDALRAYRCIEVLDGAPYFHIHGLWMSGVREPFPWSTGAGRPAALVGRLLPAWLRRYPGHAGSDDMCYRMARIRQAEGRDVEALRWASRGTTVPDGDMLSSCVAFVTALVELAPPGARVTWDVIDPAAPRRNRDLLQYLRLRRIAQDRGYREALDALAVLAAAEPDLVLARAFRERWSAPIPRGLDSGLAPLPASDPLRRVESSREGPDPETRHTVMWFRQPVADPPEDVGLLRPDLLRRQLRAWESMAALRQRWTSAVGEDSGDLLYKQAALHYHEFNVLYPAYAYLHQSRSGRPRSYALGRGRGDAEMDAAWLRGVLSWDRAIALFEELLLRDPSHPLSDDALYSMALAHVKAMDDPAVRGLPGSSAERARHLDAAKSAFARLVVEYPDSSLRPASEAALRYWRTQHETVRNGRTGRTTWAEFARRGGR